MLLFNCWIRSKIENFALVTFHLLIWKVKWKRKAVRVCLYNCISWEVFLQMTMKLSLFQAGCGQGENEMRSHNLRLLSAQGWDRLDLGFCLSYNASYYWYFIPLFFISLQAIETAFRYLPFRVCVCVWMCGYMSFFYIYKEVSKVLSCTLVYNYVSSRRTHY